MAETVSISTLTSRLQELTIRHPEITQAFKYYQQRSKEYEKIRDRIPPLDVPARTFIEKLEAKQVLFREVDLPFDPDVMQDLFIGLCQASCAKDIQKLVEKQSLNVNDLIRTALDGDTEGFTRIAGEFEINPILLAMLAQDCLNPALLRWVDQYQPLLDMSDWQRPLCPFCGSLPGLAEIQGTRGECHLRCTSCGADWPYQLMACGLCGNDNYRSLGILSVDGESEKYRVKTCDVCSGYLKTIITFEPTPARLLAFEDLVTLHLDGIAQYRGYHTNPNRELKAG